jgi:hypothetical protein
VYPDEPEISIATALPIDIPAMCSYRIEVGLQPGVRDPHAIKCDVVLQFETDRVPMPYDCFSYQSYGFVISRSVTAFLHVGPPEPPNPLAKAFVPQMWSGPVNKPPSEVHALQPSELPRVGRLPSMQLLPIPLRMPASAMLTSRPTLRELLDCEERQWIDDYRSFTLYNVQFRIKIDHIRHTVMGDAYLPSVLERKPALNRCDPVYLREVANPSVEIRCMVRVCVCVCVCGWVRVCAFVCRVCLCLSCVPLSVAVCRSLPPPFTSFDHFRR